MADNPRAYDSVPELVEAYSRLASVCPAESRNQGATVTRRFLDRIAMIQVTPGAGSVEQVTYAGLISAIMRRAYELAFELCQIETGAHGARVGLLGKNSIAWLVDFYALQLVGAVPVPLSYKYPKAAFQHVLKDAGVHLLLSDRDSLGLVSSLDSDVAESLTIAQIGGVDADGDRPQDLAGTESFAGLNQPELEDLAMVLYTSGSTGNPKGVALNHASHVWVMDTVGTSREHEFVVQVAAPLYHMNALARSQKALASGETVVLFTEFDAESFVAAIAEHSVNEITGVPPMFALLEPHLNRTTHTFPSVVHVNMASAPAGDSLFAAMAKHFPGSLVTIGYGTTESGPVAFYVPADAEVPVGSVGVPHPSVEVRLIDPSTGEPNPEFGGLEIRTGALFSEYLNRDHSELPMTADGFYHTKDLFRVDNGFYFFAGREDDMFNSGAENVYPAAVEAVLLAHPSVKEAVVVPVPDPVKTWKPVAFVTLTDVVAQHSIREGLEQELKAYTLEHLEPFAHPRRIWTLDRMPLAATNKIDRTKLAQEAAGLVGK